MHISESPLQGVEVVTDRDGLVRKLIADPDENIRRSDLLEVAARADAHRGEALGDRRAEVSERSDGFGARGHGWDSGSCGVRAAGEGECALGSGSTLPRERIGHSSCILAQRPSLGVMLSPYQGPVTAISQGSAARRLSYRGEHRR